MHDFSHSATLYAKIKIMKVLAFDTSNQPLTVTLAEDDQVKYIFTSNVARNHSIQLLSSIQAAMQHENWQFDELDRIVVAQGPGSFTGLRIGVTVAKVLANTIGTDLIGVSSLAILAQQVINHKIVVPLFNARNQNVFAGVYQNGINIKPDEHQSFANLCQWLKSNQQLDDLIFVGDTEPFNDTIQSEFPHAAVLTAEESLPDGKGIIALQKNILPVDDIDTFNPNYLRKTQAELNWLENHPGQDDPNHYVFEVK